MQRILPVILRLIEFDTILARMLHIHIFFPQKIVKVVGTLPPQGKDLYFYLK